MRELGAAKRDGKRTKTEREPNFYFAGESEREQNSSGRGRKLANLERGRIFGLCLSNALPWNLRIWIPFELSVEKPKTRAVPTPS